MKKIFFVRHAKSDWTLPGLADIDRPLNQRGYSDAHRIGPHLKKNTTAKTLFVSSPAIRAMTTALIFSREANYPQGKILICPELYEAEIGDYETVIQSLDDHYDNVFLFGHNPTISEAISKFAGSEVGEISTCAVFMLGFETNHWTQATKSKGKIEIQLSPKTLSDLSH